LALTVCNRGAQAGLECTPDPCGIKPGMLAGKMDPSLRFDDFIVKQDLPAIVDDCKSLAGKFVTVPLPRRSNSQIQ
jgi:hypothetical protein